MKTIAENHIERMSQINGRLIGKSTAWNIHGLKKKLCGSRKSNGYKFIAEHFRNNSTKAIAVVLGAKGRSQHSASELIFFDVSEVKDSDLSDYVIFNRNETFF